MKIQQESPSNLEQTKRMLKVFEVEKFELFKYSGTVLDENGEILFVSKISNVERDVQELKCRFVFSAGRVTRNATIKSVILADPKGFIVKNADFTVTKYVSYGDLVNYDCTVNFGD